MNAVTGEPIRRALVQMSGSYQASSFTNESGRFQFDNCPGGSAWFRAQKPGFFEPNNGSPRRISRVSIDSNAKDIQVKLTPEARIEGRVTNSDGEPLEGVQVQAMGEQIIEGRKRFIGYSVASTTGAGHYLIGGLAPGKYFVRTVLRPAFGGQRPGQVVAGNYPLAYPSQYFPDAADIASAQPQELNGGGDAEVDFTLTAKQTFRISGTVAGAQNYLGVFLGEPGGAQRAHYQFDRGTNRFVINLLPPGSSTLHFTSRDTQGNQYSATQEVTVAGADISGLQITLQPDDSIPVDIQQLTSGSLMGSAQVRLVPTEPVEQRGGYPAISRNGGAPGSMLVRNVPPGNYRVQVQVSSSACVESVTSGSANLLHDDLVVNGGATSPPITVVLRYDCGKLLGMVHSNSGPTPASILLVPDSGDPIVIYTLPDGSFTHGLITPGSYRVYAFSSLGNLEYANPEALRDYAGQQISLEPNQSVTVSLELIERKE